MREKHPSKKGYIGYAAAILILLAVITLLGFSAFKGPQPSFGEGIESVSIGSDGQAAFLKLKGDIDKDIVKARVVFLDKEGHEYYYETAETEGIEISAKEIGLDNFKDIGKVRVTFEYETKTRGIAETPESDTGETIPGEDGERPVQCIPGKDCSYYYDLEQCGARLNDGCDDILNCISCPDGRICRSGSCIPACTDDAGCSEPGIFCRGNVPYDCSYGEDGCLDKTDETGCGAEEGCVNGTGCIGIPECSADDDCAHLNEVCGYGVCNANRCELMLNDSADVCRAYAGECDAGEYCTGSSADCPADEFRGAGASCSSGVCDGNGNCVECVDNSYCGTGEICSNKRCVEPGVLTFDGWRVLPIRSEEEYSQGRTGGEATQHLHGIARSISNPDVIYWSQDVGQVWKSTDGGETWKRTLGRGLYLRYGQSVEVDPANPDIVFVIVAYVWDYLAEDFEGIYRSTNGGDDWEFVLPTDVNFVHKANPITHRMYKHNIAYDPSSIAGSGAKTWYAAFVDNGLYRSDDYGSSWTKAADLQGHDTLYGIQTHPSDGKTVYVASRDGLFVYSKENGLRPLGNLPPGAVSSVAINPDNNIIYATLIYEKWSRYGDYKKGDTVYYNTKYYRSLVDNENNVPDESPDKWKEFSTTEGLYRSADGGNTFGLLKEQDVHAVFMNPGYPDTLYLAGSTKSASVLITHDGGTTWIKNMEVETAPGLGRDTWIQKIHGNTGIVPNPNDRNEAVAFSESHIYKTTDGGETFAESSALFTGYAVWINGGFAFDLYDPDRFMFLLCDVTLAITNNGGNYFERRRGDTWDWYQNGDITWMGSYAGDFQSIENSQVIVSNIGNYFRTKLMRSTDEGRNWTLVTDKNEGTLFMRFHPEDPNIVYASKDISRDGGVTFSSINFGQYGNSRLLDMCLEHPDTVYAGLGGTVLRSDDRGNTWYLYDKFGWKINRRDPISTFAVDPKDPNRVYTLDGEGDLMRGVWDENTKTVSWTGLGVLDLVDAPETLDNFVRSVVIDPNHPEVIYAGMSSSGISNVWRSTDSGATWEDISYNLPRIVMQAMAVNPHTGELFVGSAVGTWIFPPPYESENMIYDSGNAYPMPSCYDGLKNGDETGVDSGGNCI